MSEMLTKEEFAERRDRLRLLMKAAGMDACLITQNVGLYYWSGSMQTGYLLIPAQGEAAYYVRRSLSRAAAESTVKTAPLGSFRNFGERLSADYPELFKDGRKPAIGADLDVMPAQLYLRLQDAAPNVAILDASGIMRQARSVKSAYEIARIEDAAAAAAAALDVALGRVRAGMSELELLTILESEMRSRGHIGLMRMRGYNQEIMTGMVAAGEAAAEPSYFDGPAGGRGLMPAAPQSASRRPIGAGEPILLDIGCCIDGYTIDQTRTAVIGDLDEELERAYEVSVRILRHAESLLRPGASPETLYAEALRLADEAGLAAHFMGFGEDQVRFLGHGIGLEIDEWPVLARGFADPLEAGVVLAIEPKFTFPGRGVVGIENTYAITADGFRTLTASPERLYRLPLHP